MKRNDQLKKIMIDYSDKNSRELEIGIFSFGGVRIQKEQTPNEVCTVSRL
jgi:hypothetical protein